MSTQIDFRTLPANVPVLCIPRVYSNISESRIRRIFDDLNMGVLERIDIVSSKNIAKPGEEKGEKFNRVFVHFRRWNDTENANIARERLLNGKEIKIIYDDPWFWKISAYRESERKPPAPQNAGHRKPTIQFDSDEERASNSRNVVSYRRHDDRSRPDDRRQDDRPVRRRPDDRYHNERPRPDVRPRPNDQKPASKSTTPPCSPPRDRRFERDDNAVPTKIDHGNAKPPMRKKRITLEVETEKKTEDKNEDGEVSEI